MTTAETWLVVRRLGSLWAVPVSGVRSVSSVSGEVSIQPHCSQAANSERGADTPKVLASSARARPRLARKRAKPCARRCESNGSSEGSVPAAARNARARSTVSSVQLVRTPSQPAAPGGVAPIA